jgi:hypothetical protein|uniref:DUF4376 domain-containing protein n=1 Tax=Roseivirga sp. TaxID=1964215 RepID=UPI004048AFB4
MNYVKVTDNWILAPYSLAQLRRDNPNVSFSKDIPESTLAEFGVFPIVETVAPSGDVVEETTPVLVDGSWQQDWVSRSFTQEELAQYKVGAKARINAIRDTKETEGFDYVGKTFQSDERSADRILVAANAAAASIFASQPFSVTWTTSDNSEVTLNAQETLGMNAALASLGVSLHEQAKVYKAQIDAAQDKNEVDSVIWVS